MTVLEEASVLVIGGDPFRGGWRGGQGVEGRVVGVGRGRVGEVVGGVGLGYQLDSFEFD